MAELQVSLEAADFQRALCLRSPNPGCWDADTQPDTQVPMRVTPKAHHLEITLIVPFLIDG